MTTEPAHFTLTDGGEFAPTRFARSHWGDDHLNGPAVAGLAARELEKHCRSSDFIPTRLTVDLFRAARSVATSVAVRMVRDGRRIRSAECDVVQEGRPVALSFPPAFDDGALTAVGSDAADLSRSPGEHQNDSRKRFYNKAIDVVAGEANSQFVRAVMVAEATSLVTNLGTRGVGYINGDNPAAHIDFANDPFPMRIT
jgi:Thioesterase-like superfamily